MTFPIDISGILTGGIVGAALTALAAFLRERMKVRAVSQSEWVQQLLEERKLLISRIESLEERVAGLTAQISELRETHFQHLVTLEEEKGLLLDRIKELEE